jgi:class 3 adenylate cyclase
LATRRRLSHHYVLQLAGLFLLIHALFSYIQIINALVAQADASVVASLFGATTSGYAVIFLLYLLLASRNALRKLPALNGRSLLIALASTICAYFAFVLVAPPRVLIFGVIPLILLAALLAYLSNLEGTIKERTDELAEEKEKTEGLLANILPQYVVEELKEKGTSTPKFFDEVAVMFTDFVGFTTITQKLPPRDLIEQLNTIFTRFDEVLEQHQSERIKTIGDAYMCVSGLSASNRTPASNLLRISKEMLAALTEINEALGTDWQIRIGVASGSCIGGIVGTRKYQFDLFGDTVNTAARMEAYSSPGCVNIDAKTYEAVCNEPSFIFKARPLTAVKGKGDQQMYFVEHTHQTSAH